MTMAMKMTMIIMVLIIMMILTIMNDDGGADSDNDNAMTMTIMTLVMTMLMTMVMMTDLPQVMGIRESLLTRIKAIRKAEDSVTICPQQKIKQEEKLSEFRMEVKSITIIFIISIIINKIRG